MIAGITAGRKPSAAPATGYRFFRLTISRWRNNGADGTYGVTRVTDFHLYTSDDTAYPTVPMTGDAAPSPLVASASSVNATGQEAWRAFDTDFSGSGRWISGARASPEWLQIDLGEGNEIAPTYAMIAPDISVTQDGGYFPLNIKIQGSATGAFTGEQVDLFTATELTSGWANSTPRRFDF